ncbi:carbon-monoxide dehydrogenase small subunit [Gemmobacter aquatilis]|uniref:Carbon-monoxide dehydrogenase small subunit n=1 Tax=Gemmobacter aquatilis TaxID=933059 RepID=A0A1H8BNT4_9RHOB|nr:(2Fe-2S)-binding protein [Gemmobacter aquatilis]SEM84446.1 carbon-monoxide dehydrogenase small subunit [Gemmobacter aquatilis]
MIRFTLNGTPVSIAAPPDRSLATILREDLGQTGSKIGCAIGRCGACMVLLDGQAMNGCLLMAWQVAGRQITTIEGIASHPAGAALLRGLTEENAFQCGYCAPGMVIALAGLLATTPAADAETIKAALTGNLCRCTGYHSILRGALRAVALLKDA